MNDKNQKSNIISSILIFGFVFPGGVVFIVELVRGNLTSAVVFGPIFWGIIGYIIGRVK
ncbi:hypothetical protein [Cellulophaga baltica]|uniref:hypothetical protein n=1 Tax=Cellulophaga baltica TaxID=76594 RepID=UPI00130DCE65|nr:hypothetical protein [Cellulophaga baltica]